MYVSFFYLGFFLTNRNKRAHTGRYFTMRMMRVIPNFPCLGAPLMHTEKLCTVPIRPLNRNQCEEAKAT